MISAKPIRCPRVRRSRSTTQPEHGRDGGRLCGQDARDRHVAGLGRRDEEQHAADVERPTEEGPLQREPGADAGARDEQDRRRDHDQAEEARDQRREERPDVVGGDRGRVEADAEEERRRDRRDDCDRRRLARPLPRPRTAHDDRGAHRREHQQQARDELERVAEDDAHRRDHRALAGDDRRHDRQRPVPVGEHHRPEAEHRADRARGQPQQRLRLGHRVRPGHERRHQYDREPGDRAPRHAAVRAEQPRGLRPDQPAHAPGQGRQQAEDDAEHRSPGR